MTPKLNRSEEKIFFHLSIKWVNLTGFLKGEKFKFCQSSQRLISVLSLSVCWAMRAKLEQNSLSLSLTLEFKNTNTQATIHHGRAELKGCSHSNN